ncbi:hypothetical protein AKJ44_01295 [candidate division MSBL1 archaeon SCGC-AAA261F17]|uniref:PIN domain-containing protein n=1 Tax=candidate division MSBL1 archaeon SCGC-AAA261F17 TaxID=1698274 RepID=A0A133V6T9_9EURY|nr:hypothetical protein AKJ44_01295 [candidate division MSBL1 archaeon SCGC-AAA261F17]
MIAVVDTNIYFSTFYNPQGNEAEVIRRANRGEVELLSPDSVREELEQVLKTKLQWSKEEVTSSIDALPTVWIPKSEYSSKLDHAKSIITHEKDSPILACALQFKTGILTGNTKHFDIPQIKKEVPILDSRNLLQYLKSK